MAHSTRDQRTTLFTDDFCARVIFKRIFGKNGHPKCGFYLRGRVHDHRAKSLPYLKLQVNLIFR